MLPVSFSLRIVYFGLESMAVYTEVHVPHFKNYLRETQMELKYITDNYQGKSAYGWGIQNDQSHCNTIININYGHKLFSDRIAVEQYKVGPSSIFNLHCGILSTIVHHCLIVDI